MKGTVQTGFGEPRDVLRVGDVDTPVIDDDGNWTVRKDVHYINYVMDEYRMRRLAAIIPVHSHWDHAIDVGGHPRQPAHQRRHRPRAAGVKIAEGVVGGDSAHQPGVRDQLAQHVQALHQDRLVVGGNGACVVAVVGRCAVIRKIDG